MSLICCSLINNLCITYSDCVFITVVILYVRRMRRIILASVDSLVLPYFSTLSHERNDKKKRRFEHEMRVAVLDNVCLKHFSV
jgi:hypothetical protein